MEGNSQAQVGGIPPLYYVETAFKGLFLFMAPFNMQYTIIVGVVASVCGVIRMLKTPQLSKVYFQKVLMNNHGQNVLYLGMGSFGVCNFLFYSPILLYFFYGLAEFYNLKFPAGSGNAAIRRYVEQIRYHRWFFL
jgi:hypothetical protein